MNISDKTVLVAVNIKQRLFNRLDKRETENLGARTGSIHRAARVNKSLLPECGELDQIKRAGAELRAYVDRNSLPWAAHGQRIMRADSNTYTVVTPGINERIQKFDDAVKAFIQAYPAAVLRAANSLGSLYDPGDYPEQWELEKLYEARVIFLPVANVEDFRLDVAEEIQETLRKQMREEYDKQIDEAMGKAWERLHGCAENAVKRLRNEKGKIYASLVDNAKELVDSMHQLNIKGDPKMFEIAKDLERALCTHNVGTLRDDPSVRKQAADQCDDVLDKMKAFYGA